MNIFLIIALAVFAFFSLVGIIADNNKTTKYCLTAVFGVCMALAVGMYMFGG